jgi:hypothetical protein
MNKSQEQINKILTAIRIKYLSNEITGQEYINWVKEVIQYQFNN